MKFLLIARAVVPAITALLLLSACESNPYIWSDRAQRNVNTSLEDSKNDSRKKDANNVPEQVGQTLLPPFQVRPPDGKMVPLEPRFDLAVNNAPARQVFMSLVDGTPYSMIVHPDVSGGITLNLKNVTVAEALRSIRETYGYDYRREGNRYNILGPGMQTRIIAVNYLNMSRKGKTDMRVSTGELSRAKGTGATAAAGSGSANQLSSSAIHSMQIETDSASDFWKDLRSTLMTLIGVSESPDASGAAASVAGGGSAGERRVIVDPQSGYVIVRAMPEELRVVEDYLERTQLAINRQVVLEAKIVNVVLSDGFQTGVNWAKMQGSSVFAQTGGGTFFNDGVSEIAGQTGNLNPVAGTNVSNALTSAFGGVFSIATNTSTFASFVELLKTQGDVNVLSSPRVSTVNNQKAVIKVGGDEFYVTGITGGTAAVIGVSAATAPTVELTPFFSGVALDVTPQIDDDNNIVLHIHPAISEVSLRTQTIGVGVGNPLILPLASSSIQESDNVVRATSGQVIVIGGLMKEVTKDNNAGLPFLSDIPILGNVFKHKQVTRVKSELIILVKPTIIEANQNRMWADNIEDAQARIRNLGKQ